MPQELLEQYKWQITFVLLGLSFIAAGILLTSGIFQPASELEVINQNVATSNASANKLIVDVSGEVNKPGVYELDAGSRVEDALEISGGITVSANTEWVEKNLNRASQLTDGQKLYIPSQSEVLSANISTTQKSSDNNLSGNININAASQNELESLPGIGPVFAQNIIEGRPYSSVEDLISKQIIRKDIYEKIKDEVSVY